METLRYQFKAGDKAIYQVRDGTLIVDVLHVKGTRLTCRVISIEGSGEWVRMYTPGHKVVLGAGYMTLYEKAQSELIPEFIESLNNLERVLKQKL